jgi:hypothetical protein
MRYTALGLTLLIVVACHEVTGPRELLPRASQTVPGVQVTVTANRTTVSPGDSVTFRALAFNGSNVPVQLGEACGPAMDVVVRAPTGREESALVRNRVYPCVGIEDWVNPGERRTIQTAWQAPTLRGSYSARAGLRRRDGLGNESPPLTIEVR